MANIFISHASADEPLVDEFVDLLQTGGDIRSEAIFCTSIDGMGIDTGEAFVEWIRDHLLEARIAILLFSSNYFASRFCVAEMGAAWGSDLTVFPIALPGLPRDEGTVFLGRQTARLDDAGLDELRDRLVSAVPDAAPATGRWNLKKKEFLEELPKVLATLPEPQMVERGRLTEMEEMLDAAHSRDQGRRDSIKDLEQQMEELRTLKDQAQVAEWDAGRREPDERWEGLVKAVRSYLGAMGKPEVRSLYASFTDEPWHPGGETWDWWRAEIAAAEERKLIRQVDDGLYAANEEHPRIRAAIAALGEMETFIGEEMESELRTRIEEELDLLVDAGNRELWEELFLNGDRFLD